MRGRTGSAARYSAMGRFCSALIAQVSGEPPQRLLVASAIQHRPAEKTDRPLRFTVAAVVAILPAPVRAVASRDAERLAQLFGANTARQIAFVAQHR